MVRRSISGGSLLDIKVNRQQPYKSALDAIYNRRIWISGALGGLGLEFCKAFLRHGCASLAVVDILDTKQGEAAIAHFEKQDWQQVRYWQVDVREKSAIRDSLNDAARMFDGLDVVINNAGVGGEEDADFVIAVNLTAIINATEAALDVLEDSCGQDKTIVNVCSAGGIFAMPVAPFYSASKFGAVGYTLSMRNACWDRGVRINCFCPGWVEVGLGRTVAKMGNTARYTGIMKKESVVEALLELLRRRDVVGEAVYVSQTTGVRLARADVKARMDEVAFAKL